MCNSYFHTQDSLGNSSDSTTTTALQDSVSCSTTHSRAVVLVGAMAAPGPKTENHEDDDEPMTGQKTEKDDKSEDAGQSHDRQLSLPAAPDITEENFREVVLKACQHLLTQFGGPVQYLREQLGDRPNQRWADFAQDLRTAFPRRGDKEYLDGFELPRVMDETYVFRVSLWQLGWLPCCSSKPSTFKVVAAQLIDEYVTNTVLTAGEPLLLYQQPKEYTDDYDFDPCFWTHYMKGAARATSMLMLAHVLLRVLKVDVGDSSFGRNNHCFGERTVFLTWFYPKGSRRNNMGRKAANPQGKRAAAIRDHQNFQCLSYQCRDAGGIQESWRHESPGSANTMLGPSFDTRLSLWIRRLRLQPRTNNDKAWQKRLLVTNEGFELFVRYVDSCHARKLPGARTKFDTAALTEALQMSQLLLSCFNEVSDQHAVPQNTRDQLLINPFLEGSNKLELELQGTISELKKGWQPAEISTFKDLIATCIAKRDGTMESLGKGPRINAGQLEKQAFDLLLSSLQHDADVYTVWKAKCNDRESALYFSRLNHSAMRHSRAREMAETVFSDDRGLGWFMSISKLENKDSANITTWQEVCAHIAKQCQLRNEDQVRSICILNWSAPSLFAGSVQNRQATLMGTIVNQ
eukprot:s1733_g8.t1